MKRSKSTFFSSMLDGFNAIGYLSAPPRMRAEDYFVDPGESWERVGKSLGAAMGLERDANTGEWVRVGDPQIERLESERTHDSAG